MGVVVRVIVRMGMIVMRVCHGRHYRTEWQNVKQRRF